jgi:ethanolamine ammonia-lyase large subunit
MLYRRCFLRSLTATAVCSSNLLRRLHGSTVVPNEPVSVDSVLPGEDIFGYIQRRQGSFDSQLYLQLLGAANEFKEGDAIVGVAAANDTTRHHARTLLANTPLASIDNHPPLVDGLFALIEKYRDTNQSEIWKSKTLGQLKQFLLSASEHDIHSMKAGLSSDVIGCLVKLMTNQELIAIGSKIFNPLPGSNIGAKGYLGARVQPNSPTDNVDDLRTLSAMFCWGPIPYQAIPNRLSP